MGGVNHVREGGSEKHSGNANKQSYKTQQQEVKLLKKQAWKRDNPRKSLTLAIHHPLTRVRERPRASGSGRQQPAAKLWELLYYFISY